MRTGAAPSAAGPAWAADPALSPPADEGVVVPPDTRTVYLTFRALDATGAESSLAAMELDVTLVAELARQDPNTDPPVARKIYREFNVVGGTISAKGIAIEVDLPSQALKVFPRMRGAPVNPAPGMANLEVYGGVW